MGCRSYSIQRDVEAQMSTPESQSTQAYRAIRTAIVELRLRPGEPLSEGLLAERFSFGRMPVRAAVNRLCHDGFLVAVARKGIYVNTLRIDDVREIYEMLEALDGMAVRLAAGRSWAADVDPLTSSLPPKNGRCWTLTSKPSIARIDCSTSGWRGLLETCGLLTPSICARSRSDAPPV